MRKFHFFQSRIASLNIEQVLFVCSASERCELPKHVITLLLVSIDLKLESIIILIEDATREIDKVDFHFSTAKSFLTNNRTCKSAFVNLLLMEKVCMSFS